LGLLVVLALIGLEAKVNKGQAREGAKKTEIGGGGERTQLGENY